MTTVHRGPDGRLRVGNASGRPWQSMVFFALGATQLAVGTASRARPGTPTVVIKARAAQLAADPDIEAVVRQATPLRGRQLAAIILHRVTGGGREAAPAPLRERPSVGAC
ncbi:MAG TPA: hypothetical protein VFG87_16740 [Amycolatopsis sp.]|nr:hypothetical protein [Amycolatopsis sp.]